MRWIITLVAFLCFFSIVCFHVPLQNASLGGCIFTLFTLVRPLPSVDSKVCLQVACWSGCKVTLITFVGLLCSVPFHMRLHMNRLQVTKGTYFYPFSCVYFHMCVQRACCGGCKVALITFHWFFTRMLSDAILQNFIPCGCITAYGAFVGSFLIVFSHVHPQYIFHRGCEVAIFTLYCISLVVFLAVQNSSIGYLVPCSGTTNNQSLHNTTEWP